MSDSIIEAGIFELIFCIDISAIIDQISNDIQLHTNSNHQGKKIGLSVCKDRTRLLMYNYLPFRRRNVQRCPFQGITDVYIFVLSVNSGQAAISFKHI